MTLEEQPFFHYLDWLQPALAEAEQLRRSGRHSKACRAALRAIRQQLKARMPDLPRLDLCGDLAQQADALLERRVELLNAEIQLNRPVDWGKLGGTDPQRNWHLGYQYWLNPLAHQYVQTGDERYARQWCQYIIEFIEQCPYAADARGYWPTRPMVENDLKTSNLGENGGPRHREAPAHQQSQWMSLSCHFRIETWLAGLARLADSPSLDDLTLVNILESLVNDQVYVCVMNPRENTPNQFTAVTLSLLKLSLLLPMHRGSASTFLVAWERLQRVFSNHLLPDGSDLEQSPDYNAFLLDLSMEVLELLKDAPESRRAPIQTAALKRLRFLTSILMPGNLQPPIGKGHTEDKTEKLLHAARKLSDTPSIEALTQQSGPLRQSISFPYGGYHCLREDESTLLFKNSRLGTGHMHEDCLSFILWHRDVELLSDPSHYTYNMNTEEEALLNTYALGTQGHNSVCINSLGQRQLPLSKSGSRADDEVPELRAFQVEAMDDRVCVGQCFAFAEGSYRNGFGPEGEIQATHQRTIVQVFGQGWLIIDQLNHLPGEARARQHWHLADHFKKEHLVAQTKSGIHLQSDQGGIKISRLDQGVAGTSLRSGSMQPVQGWVFPKYAQKAEALELVFENLPQGGQTTLLTWIESAPDGTPFSSVDAGPEIFSWKSSSGSLFELSLGSERVELRTSENTLRWSKNSKALPLESTPNGTAVELKPPRFPQY